jgi:hypothetical protein
MKKFWSLLFLLLINCVVSTAQSYYFKSLDLDTASNIIRTAHIDKQTKNIVMPSSSLLLDTADFYNRYVLKTHFTKLDSANVIQIDKSFLLNNQSIQISGVLKLKQGGYLGYGYQYNSRGRELGLTGLPGCLVRYNDNGDTIFTKLYHYEKDHSAFRSIRQLSDSSIILASLILNSSNLFTAIKIIKLDVNFNTTFDSIYYFSLNINRSEPRVASFVDAIEETVDGGLLIGSSILTRTSDTVYHALLFKIDNDGEFLWERRFNFNQDDRTEINKIIKLKDGSFLLVGYYLDNNQLNPNVDDYIFLIKVSPNGELISKKLVHAYMYHYVFDAIEKPNGDLLLAGTFAKGINGFDYKAGLMCLNNKGNVKWTRQYELPTNLFRAEFLNSDISDFEIANDGTIMAVGNIAVMDSTFIYNGGLNQDIIFLYTDSNGCVDPSNCTFTTVEEELVIPLYFQVYPNPSRGKINFSTNINSATSAYIKIYNNHGQLLFEKEITNFTEEVDVSTLPRGMYILELESKEFRNTQKLLIE